MGRVTPEVSMARTIIDANKYVSLATADLDGTPWVSPVYYTPVDYHRFLWVSSPDARHSRNIADRPQVAATIFDSTVAIGKAEAVYLAGRACLVPEDEVDAAAALFSARFDELREFDGELLRPPTPFRLYQLLVSEHFVLIRGGDPRYGRGVDSREPVHP